MNSEIFRDELLSIYGEGLHQDVELLFSTMANLSSYDRTVLLRRRLTSPLYRICSLYTIIDREGNQIQFVPNRPQHIVLAHYLTHNRPVILKSRQQGITTLFSIVFLDMIIHNSNINTGIITVDQSIARQLLSTIKVIWACVDVDYKKMLALSEVNDSATKLKLSNNSSIDLKTSFRGTTLHALHVSEMGEIANNPDKLAELINGTFQAISPNNPLIIESTAKGVNYFKKLWDDSCLQETPRKGLHFPIFLSWVNDSYFTTDIEVELDEGDKEYFDKLELELNTTIPDGAKWYWKSRKSMVVGSDAFFQEYPAVPEEAFNASIEGTHWATLFNEYVVQKGKIITNAMTSGYPVYISFDLGFTDDTSMIYFQVIEGEVVIFDEYIASLKPVSHYVDIINQSPLPIEKVFLPHDGNNISITSGTSVQQIFITDCDVNSVVLPKEPRANGREAVRRLIPHITIDKRCVNVIHAFRNYRRKNNDYQAVNQDIDVHDKASHTADSLRYMASAINLYGLIKRKVVGKKQSFKTPSPNATVYEPFTGTYTTYEDYISNEPPHF